MSSSPDRTVADSPPNVLRILAGLHAGATRPLAEREMILVGSGEDCDIVLADAGVARHHALLNLLGDVSSLRALDAPLRIDGQPLHPGDPIELKPLQRIQLGDAAIAYGAEADPRWSELQPGITSLGDAVKRVRGVGMRRLPMIVALAVLSLASLAIFAAVMPSRQHKVDAAVELRAMMTRFHVEKGQVVERDGTAVLRGVVVDGATRDKMQQLAAEEGLPPDAIDLRTGQQIASDVGEVLRVSGISAETRYLGDGQVEAVGRFEDPAALKAVVYSRMMREIVGLAFVKPRNLAGGGDGLDGDAATANADGQVPAAATPAAGPARIVEIVRGKDPHLVALDGAEYRVGNDVPGLGKLLVIGEMAQVLGSDGVPHPVKVEPQTEQERIDAEKQRALATAEMVAKAAGGTAQAATAAAPATPVQKPGAPQVAAAAPPVAKGQPQPVADPQKR